jgi:hypothetical protein
MDIIIWDGWDHHAQTTSYPSPYPYSDFLIEQFIIIPLFTLSNITTYSKSHTDLFWLTISSSSNSSFAPCPSLPLDSSWSYVFSCSIYFPSFFQILFSISNSQIFSKSSYSHFKIERFILCRLFTLSNQKDKFLVAYSFTSCYFSSFYLSCSSCFTTSLLKLYNRQIFS